MERSTDILPGADAVAVARAAEALAAGGFIGLPTETVYGLACDALNPRAVAAVFAAKRRPSFDPLIVHARGLAHAQTLGVFDATAARLAERFWPGPMTLVLPRRVDDAGGPIVPDLVTAGLPCVGLRVPAHPVAQAVLRESGLALAAPSANRFGSISPTSAQHVVDELDGEVGLVLDGGACGCGVESTVVSVEAGGVTVLRLGATPVEEIEAALPGVKVAVARPTSAPGGAAGAAQCGDGAALPSPGMTERHYAPRTPLYVLEQTDLARIDRGSDNASMPEPFAMFGTRRQGLIGWGDVSRLNRHFEAVRSLSHSGDAVEAAANLFAVMRELDRLGLDRLVAVPLPEEGLGRAINDRLRRASAYG